MRKIFVLLNIICAGLLFTCISYAENSNESHEDKVKHSIKSMDTIQRQKKGLKISKNIMLQLCQTILFQTDI